MVIYIIDYLDQDVSTLNVMNLRGEIICQMVENFFCKNYSTMYNIWIAICRHCLNSADQQHEAVKNQNKQYGAEAPDRFRPRWISFL